MIIFCNFYIKNYFIENFTSLIPHKDNQSLFYLSARMKNFSSRVLLLFPSEEVLAAVSIILSMMLMLLCGNIKMKNIIRGAISRLDKEEKKKKTMRWLTIFISGYLVPFSWIFLLSLLRICVLNERSRGRIPCWCNRSNIKMHFMRWLSRDIFYFLLSLSRVLFFCHLRYVE